MERFACFAMGGAPDVQAQGMVAPGEGSGPNISLLWRLFFSTQRLYRYLSIIAVVLLGLGGTYAVELRVEELASPIYGRLAWGITLLQPFSIFILIGGSCSCGA
jgi:hypothetical protein